jgi:hypothetical protein
MERIYFGVLSKKSCQPFVLQLFNFAVRLLRRKGRLKVNHIRKPLVFKFKRISLINYFSLAFES